jgi:hypothetical protein
MFISGGRFIVKEDEGLASLAQDAPPLAWALAYAAHGFDIFPCAANKHPLTANGFKDATVNPAVIKAWWARWTFAEPAWALPSDVVVADLDEKNGKHGVADFKRLEGRDPRDVMTPMATTPSGGLQLFYATAGKVHQNKVAIGGSGIDKRTAGGYVVLPSAGNGRTWLCRLGDTPMADAPAWLDAAQKQAAPPLDLFRRSPPVSSRAVRNLGLKLLERSCALILSAPNGAQDETRHAQCFFIGALIKDNVLDYGLAYEALLGAAQAMPAYGRPWRHLDKRVARSIRAGMERAQ